MKRPAIWIILALIPPVVLTGCAGLLTESTGMEETTPQATVLQETEKTGEKSEETVREDRTKGSREVGNYLLSSLNTHVDSGRILRLDMIGKKPTETEPSYGIREIRVYENGTLLQSILANVGLNVGDEGAMEYTRCPSIEAAVTAHDVNFDGIDDLDLYGWRSPDASIARLYWLWDSTAGQYRYAFTMAGMEVHTDTQQITSWYSYDSAHNYTDYYHYGENGTLELVRREIENWRNGTPDFPLIEYYEFPDGVETLVKTVYTDYDEEGIPVRQISELVNGELQVVRTERDS